MYDQAISLLTSSGKFHIKLGLERVQGILEYFGNPQDRVKCIHAAGTNGKGSTCAMLESVLRHAGYKTGLYTSPHLVQYTERIRINSEEISRDDFARVVFRVIEQIEPQNTVYYDEKELPVFGGDKSKFNRELLSFYKQCFQGKSIQHKILGEIKFFAAGIRKTIHINSIQDLKLLTKLNELIKNGKYIKTEFPYKQRKDGIIRFHTLLTKIRINNSFKNLEIKIVEDNKERKFYFYKEQSPGTLPGKTGVTETSDYIIPEQNSIFNPDFKNPGTLPGKTGVSWGSNYIILEQDSVFNPAYPQEKIPATEFEILTAAAFIYFYERQVDFAIIETGLGGRLDATNTIKNPELCIITDIDLDHTSRLGGSIEEIAFEKAGIIKPGVPVITLEDNKGLEVISNKTLQTKSPVYITKQEKANSNENELKGVWHGRNLALVKRAVRLLRGKGFNIPGNAEKQGIENALWPARFQYVREENLIIDAAHNPAAALALRQTIDKYFPDSSRIFIYSSLNTKDYKKVIDTLFREEDRVILTKSSSLASVDPNEMPNYLKNKNSEVYISQNIEQAMDICRKISSQSDLVIFTGSIYAIGEFFEYKNKLILYSNSS